MEVDVDIIKLIGTLLPSLILFGLVFAGFLYFNQENMIFAPEKLPPDSRFPFQGPFEELVVPVGGAQIHALHFKTVMPKGVVLYFHGNAGSLMGWGEVATDFTRRGYDIIIPDYRGFGKSTGRIENEEILFDDAQIVYNQVKGEYPENKIILYGRSIGTGIAVNLARKNRPRMVILESPFYNLIDLAKIHYRYIPSPLLGLMLRYPMRSDLWIAEVTSPVYVIHGENDDIIPFREGERLSKLIRSQSEMITVPGGGHNDLADFPRYGEVLDRILR